MAAHSACTVRLTVRLAWWVRPYLCLTAFGVQIGLPINIDVVVRDVLRGMRLYFDGHRVRVTVSGVRV